MTTYYIDPVNGNDAWTGTLSVPTPIDTPTDGPFKTWTPVSWVAGNTYLQKAGTIFNGMVTVGASGTAGSEIVIGAYDANGIVVYPNTSRAKINAAGFAAGMNMNTRSYLLISGFEIYGVNPLSGSGWTGIGVTTFSVSCGSYLTVDNCYLHHNNYNFYFNIAGGSRVESTDLVFKNSVLGEANNTGGYIICGESATTNSFGIWRRVTLDNLTYDGRESIQQSSNAAFYRVISIASRTTGDVGTAGWDQSFNYAQDVTIKNCTFQSPPGYAMTVVASNCLTENNVVTDAGIFNRGMTATTIGTSSNLLQLDQVLYASVLKTGVTVSGTGIPANTTLDAISVGGVLTLSQATTFTSGKIECTYVAQYAITSGGSGATSYQQNAADIPFLIPGSKITDQVGTAGATGVGGQGAGAVGVPLANIVISATGTTVVVTLANTKAIVAGTMCTYTFPHFVDCHGIWVAGFNHRIIDNEVNGTTGQAASYGTGCGILLDLPRAVSTSWGCQNSMVRGNIITNTGQQYTTVGAINEIVGCGILDIGGRNNHVDGNLINNCRAGVGVYGNKAGIKSINVKFLNNLIQNSTDFAVAIANGATDISVENNIVIGNVSWVNYGLGYETGTNAVVNLSEKNNFVCNIGADSYATFDDVMAVTTRSAPATNIITDSAGVNLNSEGQPLYGSTAISAGIFVGNIEDATGMKFHNPPSIGAYEFRQITPRAVRVP